jgi:FkbM family methyltransferase
MINSMKLVQQMARLIYPHGTVRSVLRGPLRGTRFVVMPGMAATFALGMDTMNWGALRCHVKPGVVVYDIGGNCGQMALFFARMVGTAGRVFSFEPVPRNAAVLRRNLGLNGVTNVEVVEAAVAADSEPRNFCFDAGHHTMGTLEEAMVKLDTWNETFQVACVRLDDYLAEGHPPPDLMKIDVEGSGLGVIEGAADLIQKYLPGIYFEIHAADAAAPELRVLHLLRERWGYRIHDLDGTLLSADLGPMWGEAVWCEAPPAK